MPLKVIINEPIGGLTDQTRRLYYGQQNGFSLIRGQRGQATIVLEILAGDSYESTTGSPIYVHEVTVSADVVVYAGIIVTKERRWQGDNGPHYDTLNCVSLERCFDDLRISPRAYTNMTAKAIMLDLLATVCTGVPVTAGDIANGATLSVVYRWDRVSDAFANLATQSGLIWGVRMSDSTLYMHDETAQPAPFTLDSYLYESGDWKEDETDFRNTQAVQISFTAFSTSNEMFAGDGVTKAFTLRNLVDRVVSAMLTTSTQATAIGSFGTISPYSPAQPSPGDTVTITPPHDPPVTEDPYTFVSTLDNTVRNQVLIGANAFETCANFVDAINANEATRGIAYSFPTWENDACNADPVSLSPPTNQFTLRVRNPGSGGNQVQLTTTSATFHWEFGSFSPITVGTTEGGTDGTTAALNVGVQQANTLTVDLQFTPGSAVVNVRNPVPAGQSLSVAYYRLGGDTITVQDTALVVARAAAEHGNGVHAQLITDTLNTDAKNGYEKARAALAAYKVIPQLFQFTIDKPLLSPGMLLTILIVYPIGAPVLLDGDWLVQEVNATMETLAELPEPYGHFRYTVKVINTKQVGTFVDFWENLAIVSPVGAQTVNNVSVQVSTPSISADPTGGGGGGGGGVPGVPALGQPVMTAGQQWVQELALKIGTTAALLTFVPTLSATTKNQIAIISKDGVVLRPFKAGDSGFKLPATGWEYKIVKNKLTFAASISGHDILATYFAAGTAALTSGKPDCGTALDPDVDLYSVITEAFLFCEGGGTTIGDSKASQNVIIQSTTPQVAVWGGDGFPVDGQTPAVDTEGGHPVGAIMVGTTQTLGTGGAFSIMALVKVSSANPSLDLDICYKKHTPFFDGGFILSSNATSGSTPGLEMHIACSNLDLLYQTTADVRDDTYHVIIVTTDGTQSIAGTHIYVDGTAATVDGPNSQDGNGASLVDNGALNFSGGNECGCAYSCMIFFNAVLTSDQIAALSKDPYLPWR